MVKQRLHWIDIAKGFCMLAVILGHFHKPEWDFLYSFHLTVFFILSGYTMKNTPVTKEYIKSKFQRLMVPYFITCFAVTVVEIFNLIYLSRVSTIVSITGIIYKNILRTFFASGGPTCFGTLDFGRAIGAIWFLPAMFFAIVITQYLINKVNSQIKIIVISIAFFAVSAVVARFLWLPFSVLAGAFAVPFVYLGVIIREYDLVDKYLKLPSIIILATVFVIGCKFGYGGMFYIVSCITKDWLFTPLMAICSSFVVIGLSKTIKRCLPLEFIGKNSLDFLCVHLIEMYTFQDYYNRLILFLKLPDNYYITFFIRVIVITIIAGIVVLTKQILRKVSSLSTEEKKPVNMNRDPTIDIFRTMLIVLMIIGHFEIDRGFRNVIYSFHMMAFVIISGYFYKPGTPFFKNLKKTIKSLLPYLIFSVLYIIITRRGWFNELLTVLGGISYTKNIFTSLTTVGPVYFILLLFVTKVIYMCIDLLKKEWMRNLGVLIVLVGALVLGEKGYWLPWSVDCAMFSVVFYHIGFYLKKYNILEKCKERPYIYFILSPIWMYMVYMVPMEISVRRYGVNIGLTIIGVVSACIIVYLMCNYFNEHFPKKIVKLICLIGQSTPQILVLHTLFSTKIINFIHETLGMERQNIYCLVTAIFVQVFVSVVIFLVNRELKRFIKSKRNPMSI